MIPVFCLVLYSVGIGTENLFLDGLSFNYELETCAELASMSGLVNLVVEMAFEPGLSIVVLQ